MKKSRIPMPPNLLSHDHKAGKLDAKYLIDLLTSSSNPSKVEKAQRFFKMSPGSYSETDRFLGITMPEIREIAKQVRDLKLDQIERLLQSQWHEARMLGYIILLKFFRTESSELVKTKIYDFVLKNIQAMNNWDLVDVAAPTLIGETALKDQNSILNDFILSDNIWLRRIAIVGSFPAIKNGEFEQILKFILICKNDREDLIHKACGWMLREIGKRNLAVLRSYLESNSQDLPRTTLRYAIERMSPEERKQWLRKQ